MEGLGIVINFKDKTITTDEIIMPMNNITVLPKLNAWPETTIAQRNTEGHQSRSNYQKTGKTNFTTQMCER